MCFLMIFMNFVKSLWYFRNQFDRNWIFWNLHWFSFIANTLGTILVLTKIFKMKLIESKTLENSLTKKVKFWRWKLSFALSHVCVQLALEVKFWKWKVLISPFLSAVGAQLAHIQQSLLDNQVSHFQKKKNKTNACVGYI